MEPILPMILQIQNGLESYGVLDKIKMHTELFKPLFVYSEDNENTIDSQKFLDSLLIMYSETGSNAKEKEVNTYKYFCDILEEFDHGFETEIEGKKFIFYIIFLAFSCILCPHSVTMFHLSGTTFTFNRSYLGMVSFYVTCLLFINCLAHVYIEMI